MTLRTIFEPLVVLSPSGRFQPFLASEMKVEDHGRRFRFVLRPNVTFHDGRPLTSADVQYTIEAVVKRARRYRGTLSLFHAELLQVQEVRAIDERTVELVLQRRNHLFPAVLAELPVLPSHLYHKHGLRNPRLSWAPVGTGPFMLAAGQVRSEYKRSTVTLVRSPSYWGRRPGLSRLVFTAIPDPAAALARLRNGEIDMIPNLHPSYYPDQIKGERMQRRFAAFRILPYRLRLLLFNVRPGPTKDRRVRVAIAHLADRQRVVREVRNNLGQVSSIPIWPLSPWYDKSIHPYDYDRPAAARLLTSAGWKPAKQGGRRLMGGNVPLRLRLLVARESPQMLLVANLLKNEIQASGGSLEIKVGDFGYVKTRLRRGSFDLALVGIAPRPQSDLSPLLHSKGHLNLGGYKNPVVDRLLDGVRGTSREGFREELLRQLYRALHNDPPFLILYTPIELMVVSREVKGVASNGRRPVFSTLSR